MSYVDLSNILRTGKVPLLTIIFCAVSVFAVTAVIVVMPFFFKKKYDCRPKYYFFGWLTWLAFAIVLEGYVHTFFLSGKIGETITSNLWLYGLYAGIMAGLFEETGRFLCMKFVLKDFGNNRNALMYGAGHGGFEAFYLLGFGMISNIINSVSINNGTIMDSVAIVRQIQGEETATATMTSLVQLIVLPSSQFIVGLVERIPAMAIHFSLSVFVWFAIKNSKAGLWFAAFGLHFLVDALTVLVNGIVPSIWITEAVVFVMAAVIVLLAVKLYKKYDGIEPSVAETTEVY